MAAPDVGGARSRLDRHVPGLGLLRGYRRAWVRAGPGGGPGAGRDPGAAGHGVRRAGRPPAVTGLYTTIACLVGYAVMGPSRILVLGPDSSVSPLIFAAIAPLVARRRPGHRHRARRHAGADRRRGRDRSRCRAARLRRRPALGRGAGRLHERARHHHHRRPAAEALRLLHRRRRVRRRAARLRLRPRPDATATTLAVGLSVLAAPARAAPGHQEGAGHPGRDRRGHRRSRPCWTSPPRA